MASLLSSSQCSVFFTANPKLPLLSPLPSFLSFTPSHKESTPFRFPSLRLSSSLSDDASTGTDDAAGPRANISDEWGEEAEPDPDSSFTRFSEFDPPKDDDEWGGDGYSGEGNGRASAVEDKSGESVDDKLLELKRCLVDTVYGTEFGFRAGVEERAEVLEIVNQLEAANPTPAPVEAPELLDGNWILLYTAFSELLPLLALGTLPLVKVEKITQEIDSNTLTIVNSTTLSSPFTTFSFSASAAFEVRTPSRIQVQFKEGILQPPEIKSRLDLPENIDIFGQRVNLSPVQQTLDPIQQAIASLFQVISGQPPLKIPIPGDRNRSWLLTTYLDQDLRISRGDGGLFVLVKEGSTLLNQ
ncbi:plastoglobulin-1, chloroplastic [Momordica charantia]|uniref:Plastoglobulin-1, chloroplastic n=1 Tax=Momordica charantia TaxID=3673 RepID=A0A6J1CUI4_MOMCH|nr:plastoglobulin-1, chloroplastic [Momordica charantia]